MVLAAVPGGIVTLLPFFIRSSMAMVPADSAAFKALTASLLEDATWTSVEDLFMIAKVIPVRIIPTNILRAKEKPFSFRLTFDISDAFLKSKIKPSEVKKFPSYLNITMSSKVDFKGQIKL
jgi:hypothetical protein